MIFVTLPRCLFWVEAWKPLIFPVITLIPGETWGLDQRDQSEVDVTIWIILQFVFMVF